MKFMFLYGRVFLTAVVFAVHTPTVHAERNVAPARRVLQSASELDYPPFALVRQDGSADGFSVDLLKAVAHAVGLDVRFTVGPWHEIRQQLEDRRLDVLPLVAYSQERDKLLDFTAPYLRMHGTIFVRKGNQTIQGEADLKGKEVLVMRDDAAHEYALKARLSDNLILTDSFEEALTRLSQGRHDAVIVQHVVGHQLIKKLGISNLMDVGKAENQSLKPGAEPLSGFEQKFCFAVREGDRELTALLNEGLAIVIANGTYESLYNRWFEPVLPKPPIPLVRIFKLSLLIIGPVLFFLAILGIWYLRNTVSKQTKDLRQEIQERTRAEKALKQLNDTLEERIAERTELAESRARKLQAMMSELTLAEQRERRRLAEILHDHMQQLLVAAKMNCEVLSAQIGTRHKPAVGKILSLINQSIQTSREVTSEMSPPVLQQGRLSAALKWLVHWMQEHYGIRCELQADPAVDPEREDITCLLFQSIRELVFNVVKHAGVKSAHIQMHRDPYDRLRVVVSDQGFGFDPDAIWEKAQDAHGFGLFSIRERLLLMGGSLEIESSPGKGASFAMVVPLENTRATAALD